MVGQVAVIRTAFGFGMISVAHRIILSWGWERRLIALAAGAIGALALPPLDIYPAMIVPMTVAVWLIDGSVRDGSSRVSGLLDAAAAGWWLGFGYFVAGLWWLGAAFLVEADQFAWALPLGVLGLPAVLAIFTAVGFALARLLWSSGALRVLALAVALSLSEWLRGHLFTGFPWNVYGMALGSDLALAQIASVIGLYGLTIVTVAVGAAPATLVDKGKGARWRFAPLTLAAAVVVGLGAFGMMRLSRMPTTFVPQVKLRIMQPNMPQDDSFRSDRKDEILTRYLALSDRATSPEHSGIADVTHLIWPESAFPFILSRDPQALARIGQALGTRTVLITGAARVEAAGRRSLPGEMRVNYFNSVQVLGDGGILLDSTDKVHLVPFGEYLPFQSWLERLHLRQFVHIPGGFEQGDRLRRLSVPGLPPVAPLVCYEAIFPGAVVPADPLVDRPGLMLNVTNDGWFGQTAGPHQHFQQARLRAIEEGLPLVRAANTGISAVVDPVGRVLASLPLGVEAVLDAQLPKSIPPTLFARYPNAGFLVLSVLALFGALLGKRRL
jgi:apolipoprotein N-acyltransferase